MTSNVFQWQNMGAQLRDLLNQGQDGVLATVVRTAGSTPCRVGTKMLVRADGTFVGTIGGGKLELLVIQEAMRCLQEQGGSTLQSYPLGEKAGQCCGGLVEVFLEVIESPPEIFIFGAGHVGQALCRTLLGTTFRLHLIDDRAEWTEAASQLGDSDQLTIHLTEPKKFIYETLRSAAENRLKKASAIVMTYSHDKDRELIRELIDLPLSYVGLIGSEVKLERFLKHLSAEGVADHKLQSLRCPIGIVKGVKLPQEIAISTAAELLKIHCAETPPS